jgi:ABC-type cobalamin/Fe3+-siderophores transport system ATPase subunit
MSGYKGMRWFKCDLHVQTPLEPHWREEATRLARPAATDEQKTAAARTYLERCHELGLEVIGVTDHNFAPRAQDSFIHCLQRENHATATRLRRPPIVILPGFEITAQVGTGAHVLALFDADTSLDVLDGRLSALGLPFDRRFQTNGEPLPTTERLPKILEVIQRAERNPGMVIAAHPLAASGFLNDDVCEIWLQQVEFINPELLCIELSKAPHLMNDGFRRLLGAGPDCLEVWRRKRAIACVLGSDAYRLRPDPANPGNHLGYRHTWIKMSEPTVEALRQAFLDHPSRLAYSEASPDDARRHGRLVSFAIRNAAYLADQEIHFAPGFTCLIGGRGSGKSTIIEYLRFGLRQENDVAQSALQQVSRIGRTMAANTALRVKWLSSDGVLDAFAFTGTAITTNRAQVVDRDQPVASPDTVFNALQVQIFSQRQLSEMSGGTKLLEFVDRIVRKSLAGPMDIERTAESLVQTLLNKARLLATAQNELNQLEQSVIELERQWNSRSAVTTEAAAHKSAQEAKAFLDNAGVCIADAANAINEMAGKIPGKAPALPEDITGWPEPESVRAAATDVEKAFTTLETELRAVATRFQTTAGQLLTAQRMADLRTRIAAAETVFETACTAQDITAEDVGRLREIDASLRAARTNRDAKRREVERHTTETAGVPDGLAAMHASWRAETATRRQALQRLETIINQSGRLVVSTIVHQGSTDDFITKVWSPMTPDGRSRTGRTWDSLGRAIHKAFTAQTAPTSVWDFVEAWTTGAEVETLRPNADLREELRDHLHSDRVSEHWRRMRSQRIKDDVDYELFRRSTGDRAGSLSDRQLSDGQRNTILLSLLLADGDAPIIVDQPEDELDSAFIYSELVPIVRERKSARQIIFVTHNANVPVNADADLVYALRFENGKGERLAQGGLDRPDVGKAVLDIMEGSRDAFERRREKYHF